MKAKGGTGMTKVRDLHRKWMKDPEYRKDHKTLAREFKIARAAMQGRVQDRRTKEQQAKRMT